MTGPYSDGGYSKQVSGYLTLSGTYATGGFTFTPRTVGLSSVEEIVFSGEDGIVFVWNRSTAKVMAYNQAGGTPSGSVAVTPHADSAGAITVTPHADSAGALTITPHSDTAGTPAGTVSQPSFAGTTFAASTVTVADDDTAATNGTAIFIRVQDGQMGEGMIVSESSGGTTALFASSEGLKTFVVWAPVGGETIEVVDDDSAATTGTALYVKSIGSGQKATLGSVSANTANSSFDLGDGGSTVAVNYSSIADSDGGVQVYFDEDGISGSRFSAITSTGKDAYVQATNGKWIKVTYNDNPSATGVAVYFDDDAGNKYERLMFVSPTDTKGSDDNNSAANYTVATDYALTPLFFDEDGTVTKRFLHGAPSQAYISVPFADGSDSIIPPRLLSIAYDASVSTNGVAVYFDDDAEIVTERLVFVSPTDTQGTERFNEGQRLYGSVAAGVVSQPTFTGSELAGHTHASTAAMDGTHSHASTAALDSTHSHASTAAFTGDAVAAAGLAQVAAGVSLSGVTKLEFIAVGR